MPAAKHILFSEFSRDGREFIRLWMKADRDGIQDKLAERFNMSVALVYRVRKKLGLPDLHDYKSHPGKRQLCKRIKRLYRTNRSSIQIAKILWMSPENVRKILTQLGVTLREAHVTNPAYFKTRSGMSPAKLLNEIKRLYVYEKQSARQIAKNLGIDQGTVRTKLRAMNIEIEHRKSFQERVVVVPNLNIKGIFLGTTDPFRVICISPKTVVHPGRSLNKRKTALCGWCANPFLQYIDKGPRAQKFCCSSRKNRAKDYRRFVGCSRNNPELLKKLDDELRVAWREQYGPAKNRLLSVTPIIKTKEEVV